MARNRKNQTAAVRFGPAIMAVVFCAVIAGAGVNYAWQKNQISELGRHIRECENALKQLRFQNQLLAKRLADFQTSKKLEERLAKLNLGLVAPRQEQIMRLQENEPAIAPPAATGVALAHGL